MKGWRYEVLTGRTVVTNHNGNPTTWYLFGSDCGKFTCIMADAQADPTGVEGMAGADETRGWGTKFLQLLTAILIAGIIAVFGAWATANLGVAGPVAVVLFLLSAVWLYRKPIPSAAIGNGLYVTALLMFITPIVFYLPNVLGGPGGDVEGAGMFVGSVIGLFFWWFIFAVFAVVVAGLGYFANKRAKKKLEGRTV